MNRLLMFLLRVLLVLAGLIFAASLMVAMLVLMLVWALRALWFKLTGRAVTPFAMHINPRSGFEQVLRRAERANSPSAGPKSSPWDKGDVTDVEPK